MTTATFDTLALATKSDVGALRSDLDKAVLALKSDLGTAVLKLESKNTIMQWMLGFVLALQVTILFRVFS